MQLMSFIVALQLTSVRLEIQSSQSMLNTSIQPYIKVTTG